MNVSLAEDIMGLILMDPACLDMDLWVSVPGDGNATVGASRACGTTACIAGHAVLLTQDASCRFIADSMLERDDGTTEAVLDVAARMLELDRDVAGVLFHDTRNSEAVPALKFLIGRPDATEDDLRDFLFEGRRVA